jgi:hypothetical protein
VSLSDTAAATNNARCLPRIIEAPKVVSFCEAFVVVDPVDNTPRRIVASLQHLFTRRSPLLSMSVAFRFIRCYQSLATTSNLSSNYRGAAIISIVQGRNNQNGNIDLGDLNSNSVSFLFVVWADS